MDETNGLRCVFRIIVEITMLVLLLGNDASANSIDDNVTGETTMPSNVIGLANISYAMDYINWTWTGTSEPDFDHVEVYLDDVPRGNVMTGIEFYNETGLSSNTSYTIGLRSVDTSGNVNTSMATHSARTALMPDTKGPMNVTGLANISYATDYINWTWTDTSELDFDHVEVEIDGVSRGNVMKGVEFYNETGLSPNTSYTIGLRSTDTSGNVNTSMATHSAKTTQLPDTTPPTIKINKDYTNSTSVILNLTSTMNWMRLKNDDLNWTDWMPFTATKSWTLSPGDDTKKVSLKVRNDTFSNPTQFVGDEIILDATKPTVTNLSLSALTPQINEPVNIAANVNDGYISSMIVLVNSPNGNTSECKMTGDGIYGCNFRDTNWYGRYDVRILASDLAGNINNTEKTWFVTTMKYENKTVNTIGNNITEIDALKDVNTTLELVTSGNVNNEAITITMSSDISPGMNRSMGLVPFGKYISIDAGNKIENINWIKPKIFYTEKELIDSGLDENSLRIIYYNESLKMWEILSNTGVNTANINNFSGFVWANVSHLSTFGLVGSYPAPQTYISSGGGSGGGGGGGGSSGEDYTNIEFIEKYDLQISRDVLTSYKFTHENNPIMLVDITGNTSIGIITTSAEVLKKTSTLVKIAPEWPVYKNVNIWVGTSGFATPRNIKEAIIKFRVENSWMSRNNIKNSSIKMERWDGSKWDRLETSEKKQDGKYTYYEAKTNAFSNFAITGIENKESISENAVVSENATILESINKAAAIQTEKKTSDFMKKWFIIIGVFFAIGLIIEMFLWMKKK